MIRPAAVATPTGGASEQLIVTFDNDVSQASVEVGRLYPNEGGRGAHEAGHYDLYRDGVKVGEADFSGQNSDGTLDLNIALDDGGNL